jgi:hypothetical protein
MLRNKLIREILDTDKNANKRLSQIQLKNIPKEEARAVQTQLNREGIQKLNIFVSSMRKSLEHKAIITKIIAERIVRYNKLNNYIIDICSVEEILTMYNYIVDAYKKVGNTQQTRLLMKSILMSMEDNIDTIVENLKISKYKITTTRHLQSFLYAQGLYELIQEQLKKEIFHEITMHDIKHKSTILSKQLNYQSSATPFDRPNTLYFGDDDDDNGDDRPHHPKTHTKKETVDTGTQSAAADKGTTIERRATENKSTATERQEAKDKAIATKKHDAKDEGTSTEKHDAKDEGTSTEAHEAEDKGTSTEKHDAKDEGTATEKHDAKDEGTATEKHDAKDQGTATEKHDAKDEGTAPAIFEFIINDIDKDLLGPRGGLTERAIREAADRYNLSPGAQTIDLSGLDIRHFGNAAMFRQHLCFQLEGKVKIVNGMTGKVLFNK